MTSISNDKMDKELIAKQKRAQALNYLEKVGQGIENGTELRPARKDVGNGGDNTLELLLRQSVQGKTVSTTSEKDVKAKLVAQQDALRQETVAKQCSSSVWKEVPDSITGKSYYWNTVTNATQWEKPDGFSSQSNAIQSVETSCAVLPEGWVEKLHPATKQKYYIHTPSGKSSVQFPSSSSTGTTNNTTLSSNSHQTNSNSSSSTGIAVSTTNASNSHGKRTRDEDIDPLDFTGGQVNVLSIIIPYK